VRPNGNTVRELLTWARGALAQRPAGGLEAELLLGHALGVGRAWLYANSGESPGEGHLETFCSLVQRRQAGEPIAYLTGTREFWSLPLMVTPDVLIPRPETELLVETALELLPENKKCRVADLGTGSGAVALAIASERPAWDVQATDISPGALEVAKGNAKTLLPDRVTFHLGSWFEPLQGKFLLVVSNPPYVARSDPHLDSGDCRHEPHTALTAGLDGMAAIKQIVAGAAGYLEQGGWLAFEHGLEQGQASRAKLKELGFDRVETRKDLEGRDRVTLGCMQN
jgi:release factor glutamine methyltransferase